MKNNIEKGDDEYKVLEKEVQDDYNDNKRQFERFIF